MSVTIVGQQSVQLDDPQPVVFAKGNYIIRSDNKAWYSVDGGSQWFLIKVNVQVEVKNTQLMISESQGTGNVTVDQVANNSELVAYV